MKIRQMITGVVTTVVGVMINIQTSWAGSSGVTNPLANQGQSMGQIVNKITAFVLDGIAGVAAAWLLGSLVIVAINWSRSSHHAQRREETKGQLIHVLIAGVIAGGAGIITGAVYHFGAGL